jgi:hypothetical protein
MGISSYCLFFMYTRICVIVQLTLTEQVSVEYVKHLSRVSFIGSTKEGGLNPAASPH